MSEVSDVAIKRTQDSLGKLIKKPVLTEKLLRKPPFKFLHDVIHAIIDTTGFFGGLYTDEELKSENIKDRDAKIEFLQKAIDTLKLATKQEVRARPSKIVAGLEADKTNELLLAIAKAIDRKINSTEAVALVKSGNVIAESKKEPNKLKTSTKTESRKTSRVIKEPSASKKVKNNLNSDKKPQKDRESNAKLTKQSSKESTDSKKLKTKSRSTDKENDKERGRDSKIERERKHGQNLDAANNANRPDQPLGNTDNPQINGNGHEFMENGDLKPNNIETSDDLPKEDQHKYMEQPEQPIKREKSGQSQKIEKMGKLEKPIQPENHDNLIENGQKLENKDKTPEKIAKATAQPIEDPLPKSAKNVEKLPQENTTNEIPSTSALQASSDKPRSSKSKRSHHKNDVDKNTDGVNTKQDEKLKSSKSVDKLIERPIVPASKTNDHSKDSKPPRTALRSAAVRPISARPSAPRRRDRNVRQILHTESFVQDSVDQSKSDKKNTMPEFDDADNIVITESIPDNIASIDDMAGNKMNDAEIDGKQGHLVQQILETQTAILKSDGKNDAAAISDESMLNDRKSITRNMAELRKMIQKLSLFIIPLGKMMEYFQEDVDAMQIELMMWQKAGAAAEADIKEEQRTTEKLLENFKYQLAEINNSIKDHGDQINNATMNIIQNEEKISKLISTL